MTKWVPEERSPGAGKELLIRNFRSGPLHHTPSIALRVAEGLPHDARRARKARSPGGGAEGKRVISRVTGLTGVGRPGGPNNGGLAWERGETEEGVTEECATHGDG